LNGLVRRNEQASIQADFYLAFDQLVTQTRMAAVKGKGVCSAAYLAALPMY
jgi:hypothetical protein